ncbi:MAG: hypothetical protein MZV64_17780 [Ignavibacteriales bacterium]|nr:hypothetical protein [Ignavibacteriales bacterium]
MSGFKIAEAIALPFAGVTDGLLEALKREKMIEVKSSQGGLGEGAYTYGITGAGITTGARSPGPKPVCRPRAGALRILQRRHAPPKIGTHDRHRAHDATGALPVGPL